MTMVLHSNPGSPYTRKVIVLAHELGLANEISLAPIQVWEAETQIREANPLGKIPALVTEDHGTLFDSTVICAYLIDRAGDDAMLPTGAARWPVESLHALAQGATDAAISLRAEVMRGRDADPDWYAERMKRTVASGVAEAARRLPEFKDRMTVGAIAVACLLGYLDFRFPDFGWRDGNAALAAWFAEFSERPSMQATLPPG